jgi:hypothetical protein
MNMEVMMKKTCLVGILSIVLVFGFTGCDNANDNDNSQPSNNFTEGDLYGTWVGYLGTVTVTVVINASGWTTLIPDASNYNDYGTYTLTGNTASLYSTQYNYNVGTAAIVNINTIRLTLDSGSFYPGTYTLTRQ